MKLSIKSTFKEFLRSRNGKIWKQALIIICISGILVPIYKMCDRYVKDRTFALAHPNSKVIEKGFYTPEERDSALNDLIKSFTAPITIHVNGGSLEEIFREIAQQAQYNVQYDPIKARSGCISISLNNGSISSILDSCIISRPFKYWIEDRTVKIEFPKSVSGQRNSVGFISLTPKSNSNKLAPIPPYDILRIEKDVVREGFPLGEGVKFYYRLYYKASAG